MKYLFLAFLGGVAILVFVLLQWAGIQEVAAAFLGINPLYLPLIIGIPFLMMAVYTTRWNMLLKSVGVEAGWRVVWRHALIGAAINNITPMIRFGGEPVKCYLLSNEISCKKRTVLASLTMDSLITAITLLVLLYLGVFSMAMLNILDPITIYSVLIIILLPLPICSYIIYNKRLLLAFSRQLARLAGRFSPELARVMPDAILTFREELGDCVKRRDLMANALALGMTERLLEVIGLYVVLLSLGINIGLYASAVVLGFGILAGLIPLLPGGLIAYESSTILVLGVLGAPPAIAATSILLWRGVTYWMITGVGAAIGWLHGMKFALRSAFQ
jgi:uncharacterized protein (TIRG00374 family)